MELALIIIGILALATGVYCFAAFYYKSIIFGYMPYKVKTTKKIIALTFDDGPNQPWTNKIATEIEKYDGRATFFVVGKNCQRFPEAAKNLQDRGHQIGAHSYSHAFHKYFTDPLYKAEITKTKNILHSQNVTAKIFRFPWLYRTPWLIKSVKKQGYKSIISGQFAHPFEPFQIDANKIFKHTLKISNPGSIIIFHDGYNATVANRSQTLKAIKLITKELNNQGYKFVTINELLAIKC